MFAVMIIIIMYNTEHNYHMVQMNFGVEKENDNNKINNQI